MQTRNTSIQAEAAAPPRWPPRWPPPPARQGAPMESCAKSRRLQTPGTPRVPCRGSLLNDFNCTPARPQRSRSQPSLSHHNPLHHHSGLPHAIQKFYLHCAVRGKPCCSSRRGSRRVPSRSQQAAGGRGRRRGGGCRVQGGGRNSGGWRRAGCHRGDGQQHAVGGLGVRLQGGERQAALRRCSAPQAAAHARLAARESCTRQAAAAARAPAVPAIPLQRRYRRRTLSSAISSQIPSITSSMSSWG